LRIIWSGSALADKHAIWLYLADRKVDCADKVEARIESRVASLSQLPWQGRPVPGTDLRELSEHVIVYRLENEIVRIMRLWSTRERREY
jgi:plasmid stabilization system protein ParE